MNIEEIRYRLTLYPATRISKASGIHANTVRAIRKSADYNPSHKTLERLEQALNSMEGREDD